MNRSDNRSSPIIQAFGVAAALAVCLWLAIPASVFAWHFWKAALS